MKYDYDLVIIGGGSAGLSLCSAAAQLGVKVCLIDKEQLGGDCLHYGCVPSKALIKSGKVAHQMRHAEKYGLKSTSPKFEWTSIAKRIKKIQNIIQKHDHPDRFRDYGADIIFGAAEFKDPHTIKVELNQKLKKQQQDKYKTRKTATISGKKICIASGSRAFLPNIEGLIKSGFITNKEVFSLPTLPKSLAIVGGGVIASELAQVLNRLGVKVNIMEKFDVFFGRFSEDISRIMTRELKKEGIEIYLQTNVEKLEKKGNKKILTLRHGKEQEVLEVDEVLIAAGRRPNLELNLKAAGVEYTEDGIIVDRKCRTNQRHITAIGDCNGISMFTHTANYEAGVVFTNEFLKVPTKADYSQIGWTIYTDPEVASIGHDEITAKKAGLEFSIIKFPLESNDRALAESATEGFVKILVGKKDRVIGAQIVAPRAGEMIREWQLVISQKLSLSKVARSTYIYPTFGEASKWAASSHFAPKLFNPRVKKIVRLLFGYRGKV